MAYPINNLDIVEVVFEGRHEGQQVMSVMHYQNTTPGIDADARPALVSLVSQFQAPGRLFDCWRSALSVHVTDMVVNAQLIRGNRFANIFQVPAIDHGGIAGDCNPTNTAVAITRQGEAANRHNIGTIHMPGVPLSFLNNSLLQAAGFGLYSAFALESLQTYVTIAGGLTLVPVLYNRRSYLDSARPVTAEVQNFARTMHRRTVGLGS